MNSARRSALWYGALVLGVLLLRSALAAFPVDHPQARQSLLHWKDMALLLAMGFALVRLAPRAGFPDLCDDRTSAVGRFLVPLGLGVLFGVLTIGESLLHHWPNFHVPWPQSLFVYGSASVLYELKYHVLPLVLIVWAAYDVGAGDRRGRAVFWAAAVVISVYEPLNQLPNMVKMGMVSGAPWIAASFAKIFLGNLVPLVLFRRSGMLALIGFRFATYMVWHVAWPALHF